VVDVTGDGRRCRQRDPRADAAHYNRICRGSRRRFLSKPYRVQQFDGSGTLVADQIIVYDNAAEGQVGSQGLVTRRSA